MESVKHSLIDFHEIYRKMDGVLSLSLCKVLFYQHLQKVIGKICKKMVKHRQNRGNFEIFGWKL